MANQPDYARLRLIQIAALSVGAVALVGSLLLMGQFERPEIAPIVICVALAGAAFGAVFYFGCLLFEGALQAYIVSDDTEIKGQTVEMVTTTVPSGDDQIDDWVRRYVFARNIFGMSLIPLLILGGLLLFA